jgi:hypothetical protein
MLYTPAFDLCEDYFPGILPSLGRGTTRHPLHTSAFNTFPFFHRVLPFRLHHWSILRNLAQVWSLFRIVAQKLPHKDCKAKFAAHTFRKEQQYPPRGPKVSPNWLVLRIRIVFEFWSHPPFRSSIPHDPRFQFRNPNGDTEVDYLKLHGRCDDDIIRLQVEVCYVLFMKEPDSFEELGCKRIARGFELRVKEV